MSSINESIKTVLTYKDIALIASMSFAYLETVKGKVDDEVINHAHTLVNRLNREMNSYPVNDFTEEGGKPLVDDNGIRLMEYMRDVINDTDDRGAIKLDSHAVFELLQEVNAYIGNDGSDNEPEQAVMSKEQAIEAMKEGKKLTHPYFTREEWVTMNPSGTQITMDDGVKILAYKFWQDRTVPGWNENWTIWQQERYE
jgi:hypothetical protein